MIRRLQKEDLPSLSTLFKQFWNEESPTDAMQKQFEHMIKEGNYVLLGSFKDNCLVGAVMGIICRELYGSCQPFMVLENFIVDKSFQRNGIGKKLIKEIEMLALENNCKYTMLITDTQRTGARAFYKSAGYNPDTHIGFKKILVPKDSLGT